MVPISPRVTLISRMFWPNIALIIEGRRNKQTTKISFVLEQNDGLFTSSLELDLAIYLNCLIWLRLNVNEIFM